MRCERLTTTRLTHVNASHFGSSLSAEPSAFNRVSYIHLQSGKCEGRKLISMSDPKFATNDDYMRLCLELASRSTPKPTNYRVGAVLVAAASNTILATGYTLELPGNTHAEQCALSKFAEQHNVSEERICEVLTDELDAVIYTGMEPCIERLSGNLPCVDRIVRARHVKRVYTGISEPETFVKKNEGKAKLEAAGIKVVHVPGYESRALDIATAGHKQQSS